MTNETKGSIHKLVIARAWKARGNLSMEYYDSQTKLVIARAWKARGNLSMVGYWDT